MNKICKQCGEIKDVSNFTKSKMVKDGYENKCKACRNKNRLKYENICLTCGNKFKSQKKEANYCSPKCRPQNKRIRYKVKCSICGKEKEVINYKIEHQKDFYCSNECQNVGYSLKYSGENSARYNSNLTPEEREKGRKYIGKESYSKWRIKVYEKDNYTCQCCGKKINGDGIAHHKDGWNWCIDKRLDVSNGVTLDKKCHKEFHNKYGFANNTKEQYEEFILNKVYEIYLKEFNSGNNRKSA